MPGFGVSPKTPFSFVAAVGGETNRTERGHLPGSRKKCRGERSSSLVYSLRSFAEFTLSAANGLRMIVRSQDVSKKSLWQRPGGLFRSQQAERSGKGDGSTTIVHTELAIDIVGMHLDRSRRDHQLARNLLVTEILVE